MNFSVLGKFYKRFSKLSENLRIKLTKIRYNFDKNLCKTERTKDEF